MSYYEYRVVPAPKSLPKVKGQKSPEGRYSHAMAAALNAEGQEGWEFQRSETIETDVKRGFLSKARAETISVLVFRRWVEVDGAQSAHPFEPAMAPAPAPTPEEAFATRRVADPEPQFYQDDSADLQEPVDWQEPEETAPEETRSPAQSLVASRDRATGAPVPPLRAHNRD